MSPATPAGRPQVVAHRGASYENAEHTLGAYVAALDAGAEGLECDVRLTADGHLVCVHDRDLRRTAGRRDAISTMDLAELERLDVASWKNPWAELDDEAPIRDESLDRVLTLRKLLETAADYHRRDDRLSGAVFDSTVEPGGKQRAVYVVGRAREIPADELDAHLPVAFDPDRRGGRAFAIDELVGDADLRLYVLHVEGWDVHVGAGHPTLGTGRDRRIPVDPRPPETIAG